MRRRAVALFIAVAAAFGLLAAGASPADARGIEIRVIGCDSLLNWPCPGPMPAGP